MSARLILNGGPFDGRDVPWPEGREVLMPMMMPHLLRAGTIHEAFSSRLELHRYGSNGRYLGIQPPRDFPVPFPQIEPFDLWARVVRFAHAWWPQVNIVRLTHDRKLTVNVSIPAAYGRR